MTELNFTEAAKVAHKEALKAGVKKSAYGDFTTGLLGGNEDLKLDAHKKFSDPKDRELPNAISRVKTKEGDTTVKTNKTSGLGQKLGKIEELHDDLERLRERAKDPMYQDVDKGPGKKLAKEITDLEGELKKLGNKAQKGVAETIEAFDKRHTAAKKQHGELLVELDERAAKFSKPLDRAEIDVPNKKLVFDKKNLPASVTVDINTTGAKGTYTIGTDGTITPGEGATALDKLNKEHLKEIKRTATKEVKGHFDKQIDAHKERFTVAEQEAEAVRKHLKEKVGKTISDKTTIGEWTGKAASSITPGGSEALAKGVIGKPAWEKLGKETTFGQTTAAAKANWKQSGMVMKGVRGAASLGGLYVAVTSGFDLLKHAMGGTKKDEAGNDIPTTGSDLVVDAAKLGAGAGAVYLALISGGKNKALGLSA